MPAAYANRSGGPAPARVPTVAVYGDQTSEVLRATTLAVADTVPGARRVALAGEDHGVLHHPEARLPTLAEFLA